MTGNEHARPAVTGTGAETERLAGAGSSPSIPHPGMRVAGELVIDVSGVHDHDVITRRVKSAAEAPAWMAVLFVVAAGQHPPMLAVDYLRRAGRSAAVTVRSTSSATVTAWCAALHGQVVA